MKELVVISGKGGTGKTSLVASFAVLAKQTVVADCDVDAADLHLILNPEVKTRRDFISGHEAVICQAQCAGCGICQDHCRFDAIRLNDSDDCEEMFYIDGFLCEGCGVCVRFCPELAIDFPERLCGEWMVSDTRCGVMVHAQLGVAAENSGKLVSIVRREARKIAVQQNIKLIIVDGPPGIGCPVIASITGADLVLIVTEPTVSGLHDLRRVADVAKHFEIPALVCINKWDINTGLSSKIEQETISRGMTLAGKIRYDLAVTDAQIHKQAAVEYQQNECTQDIRAVWEQVETTLNNQVVFEN
jgi:MinD superfamily P-loop ATPase